MTENTVVMTLKDYNAMKRKADLLEHIVRPKMYLNDVDIEVDLKLIADIVRDKAEELLAQLKEYGGLPEGELVWKSPASWYEPVATIAKFVQDEEA